MLSTVLAITAGGPDEDTYGMYCNTYIDPCLAGLFSYTWMNYAENVTYLIIFRLV